MSLSEYILDNAAFLFQKRKEYTDLLARVDIVTDWKIIEDICSGKIKNVEPAIEQSLAMDVLRISAAGL